MTCTTPIPDDWTMWITDSQTRNAILRLIQEINMRLPETLPNQQSSKLAEPTDVNPSIYRGTQQ